MMPPRRSGVLMRSSRCWPWAGFSDQVAESRGRSSGALIILLLADRVEELLVLDVPNIHVRPPGSVTNQLSEPPVGVLLCQRLHRTQQLVAGLVLHGNTSLILGKRATLRFGRS